MPVTGYERKWANDPLPGMLEGVKQVGTVASLWRYPIKSMGGERVLKIYAAPRGLRGDRRLAFTSAGAPTGKPMLSGEERTAMLRSKARFHISPDTDGPVAPSTAEVETPDGTRYRADDPALIPALQAGLAKQNAMWLMGDDQPFMDCRPIALMSQATLDQLSEEMGCLIRADRFRENILLDLPGLAGFGEDSFVGRTIRIGNTAEITIKERDPRCRIITVDPATGNLMPELMKLVAREHESRAGVYGIATVSGILTEGDPILLL